MDYHGSAWASREGTVIKTQREAPTEGEASVFRDPSNVPGEGIIVGSVQMPAAAPLEAIGKIRTAIGSVTIMRADGVIVRAQRRRPGLSGRYD